MYKLIAIDLDGTLLNSYGELTQNTKNTLRKIINNNIEIVLASGRTVDSIKNIAKDIGKIRYIIAGNGAIVHNINSQENIYEKYIEKNKALEIMKICEDNSITYNVYTDKTIIASALKYNILYYYKENLKKEEDKKTSIKIVENIYEYIKNINKDEKIVKISVCDKNKEIFKSIMRKLNEITDVEILDISHMAKKKIKAGTEEIQIEYYYTEISEKNVDKWNALSFLLEKSNIQKENIIAIGDNINDKKMIEEAGLGIAMKGSTPEITNIADYITDTNNEDGVAKALLKLAFQE